MYTRTICIYYININRKPYFLWLQPKWAILNQVSSCWRLASREAGAHGSDVESSTERRERRLEQRTRDWDWWSWLVADGSGYIWIKDFLCFYLKMFSIDTGNMLRYIKLLSKWITNSTAMKTVVVCRDVLSLDFMIFICLRPCSFGTIQDVI